MRDFKKLKVWEKAHKLTVKIYRMTQGFPKVEQYGLTSQMRRSAASVPSNIAEGCGRTGDAELGRFLGIAAGSASELEYQLLLAHDLDYLSDNEWREADEDTVEVKRMLSSFISRVRKGDADE